MSHPDSRRQLLASLLSVRQGNSITDTAAAVSPLAPRAFARRGIGRIFLTNLTGARRGNPTERLLFAEKDSGDKACDRWARGVLIVSHTIQPPAPNAFLDPCVNGRKLFGGKLFLRVVSVALPPFEKAHVGAGKEAEALQEMRELVSASEEELRSAMECGVRWLMGKKEMESHKYFSTAPPTLSVPVYYYTVHMEDNAKSRVVDVLDVSIGFMDAMIDAKLSITRTTTVLLQAIVQLSNETTGDDIDPSRLHTLYCDISNQCKKETKEKHTIDESKEWDGSEKDCVNVDNVSIEDTPARPQATDLSLCQNSDEVNSFSSVKASSEIDTAATRVMNRNEELPGVLVHCMKGASRSPSIVMAYYMHKFTAEFCASKSFSFLSLLKCLREARPVVDPQICFIVELISMWSRLAEESS